MDKLKLEFNKPKQGELKYGSAKRGESKIPGKGDWFMYTLTSGEVLFIDSDDCQEPDRMFEAANVGTHDPFTICLRKSREGGRYYEVHKISDAREQEPELDPRRYPDERGNVTPFDAPTAMERKLEASIAQAQQRKAVTPQCAPPVASRQSGAMTAPPRQANSTAAGQTLASSVMASCLIAAIDATSLATQYAASKGFGLTFAAEDIRAVAATLYIQAAKNDPLFAERSGASNGATWRQ